MNIRLIEAVSLIKLAETFQDKKLPIKVAFKLNKLLTSIDGHFTFYKNKLNELVNEYGDSDENGKPILTENGEGRKIKDEYKDECQKQMQELFDLIVEIPDNITFTFDELEKVEISIQDMHLFSQFISENE